VEVDGKPFDGFSKKFSYQEVAASRATSGEKAGR